MLIIPRWMGKKGFIALSLTTLVVLLLLVVVVQEYRARNQRMMAEIYERVGAENFVGYSRSVIDGRDSGLFPLKSRKDVDRFLSANRNRLDIADGSNPSPTESLEMVQSYDRDFVTAVEASSKREPLSSEEAHLESFNFTGVRSRLISIFSQARFVDCDEIAEKLITGIEINENLCGGGNLVEELVRQSILGSFCDDFRIYLQRCRPEQISAEDLDLLLQTLDRVESPLMGIRRAIKTELLGSIELVNVNRSQVFPSGAMGYVFEPDIHFYLSYQMQLLDDLEELESLQGFTPLPELPWYAMYTKVLLMGESALNNALNNSRAYAALLGYTKDYLKIISHWKTTGEEWDGSLSPYSEIVGGSGTGDGPLRLVYIGPELPSAINRALVAPYTLP